MTAAPSQAEHAALSIVDGVLEGDEADYFKNGKRWDHDRLVANAKEIKLKTTLMWLFAGLLVLTITGHFVDLALRSDPEPLYVRITEGDGVVQYVDPPSKTPITFGEKTHKYWLARYVTLWDSYSLQQARGNYNELEALTDPSKRADLARHKNLGGAGNLFARYGANGTAEVETPTVSLDPAVPNRAEVFYRLIARKGNTETVTRMRATLYFKYVAPSRKAKIERYNPAGFLVTDWRFDQEAVEPPRTIK